MGNPRAASGHTPIRPLSAPSRAPSLLYSGEPAYTDLRADALLVDLNLGPIIAALSEGCEWADLPALFQRRPTRREDVEFRLEILRDLRVPALRQAFEAFAQSLRRSGQHFESAAVTAPTCVRQKWRLDACVAFCGAVDELLRRVGEPIRAPGLRRFRAWLSGYADSQAFRELRAASAACDRAFGAIRYQLAIDMPRALVTLSPDSSDADFCGDLAALFPQFDLSAARQEIVAFSDIHPCALEERLLEILTGAHPAAFEALDAFCRAYGGAVFPDPCLAEFQRELALYLACLRFCDAMGARGFDMCLPRLAEGREIHIAGGYDASLALKSLDARDVHVVPNDFHAAGSERCFVLTGPNQAGKTTFARMLGQTVFFASLGLPVFGRSAEIGFYRGLYTHFAVEEDPTFDSGRLKEELTRLRPLLAKARGAFVILNELFASTTTLDALQMAGHALQTLSVQGCTCLYVTHLYELAAEAIDGRLPVSLVADGGDAGRPAFTIARRSAQGLGLSHRLLEKHQLDRQRIKERYHAAFPATD